MTSHSSPISSSELPKTPIWSSVLDVARTPERGITPAVGLIEKVPQKEAGRLTDPMVCEPTANGARPAATAAADPDEDPPGVCAVMRVAGRGGLHEGKLGRHRLAHDDGTLAAQRGDGCPVPNPAAVAASPAFTGHPIDDVLETDRNAMKAPRACHAGEAGRIRPVPAPPRHRDAPGAERRRPRSRRAVLDDRRCPRPSRIASTMSVASISLSRYEAWGPNSSPAAGAVQELIEQDHREDHDRQWEGSP